MLLICPDNIGPGIFPVHLFLLSWTRNLPDRPSFYLTLLYLAFWRHSPGSGTDQWLQARMLGSDCLRLTPSIDPLLCGLEQVIKLLGLRSLICKMINNSACLTSGGLSELLCIRHQVQCLHTVNPIITSLPPSTKRGLDTTTTTTTFLALSSGFLVLLCSALLLQCPEADRPMLNVCVIFYPTAGHMVLP